MLRLCYYGDSRGGIKVHSASAQNWAAWKNDISWTGMEISNYLCNVYEAVQLGANTSVKYEQLMSICCANRPRLIHRKASPVHHRTKRRVARVRPCLTANMVTMRFLINLKSWRVHWQKPWGCWMMCCREVWWQERGQAWRQAYRRQPSPHNIWFVCSNCCAVRFHISPYL